MNARGHQYLACLILLYKAKYSARRFDVVLWLLGNEGTWTGHRHLALEWHQVRTYLPANAAVTFGGQEVNTRFLIRPSTLLRDQSAMGIDILSATQTSFDLDQT